MTMEYFTLPQGRAMQLGAMAVPVEDNDHGVVLIGLPDVVVYPETGERLPVLHRSWGTCPKCSGSVPYLQLAGDVVDLVFACETDGFLWCKSRDSEGQSHE